MAGEEDVELRDLVAQSLEAKGVLGKIRVSFSQQTNQKLARNLVPRGQRSDTSLSLSVCVSAGSAEGQRVPGTRGTGVSRGTCITRAACRQTALRSASLLSRLVR